MLGKLFGAWLGNKVAGKNEGVKGAALGYGAAALAKRSVPTLAAVAALGWVGKKLWNRYKDSGDGQSSGSASSSRADLSK